MRKPSAPRPERSNRAQDAPASIPPRRSGPRRPRPSRSAQGPSAPSAPSAHHGTEQAGPAAPAKRPRSASAPRTPKESGGAGSASRPRHPSTSRGASSSSPASHRGGEGAGRTSPRQESSSPEAAASTELTVFGRRQVALSGGDDPVVSTGKSHLPAAEDGQLGARRRVGAGGLLAGAGAAGALATATRSRRGAGRAPRRRRTPGSRGRPGAAARLLGGPGGRSAPGSLGGGRRPGLLGTVMRRRGARRGWSLRRAGGTRTPGAGAARRDAGRGVLSTVGALRTGSRGLPHTRSPRSAGKEAAPPSRTAR